MAKRLSILKIKDNRTPAESFSEGAETSQEQGQRERKSLRKFTGKKNLSSKESRNIVERN